MLRLIIKGIDSMIFGRDKDNVFEQLSLGLYLQSISYK